MAAYNHDALRAMVHYVTCKFAMQPDKLGSTKLHKILWNTEVRVMRKFGESIAAETFNKMPFGPCSDHLNLAIDDLVERRLLFVNKNTDQYESHVYVGNGAPDTSEIHPAALKVLDAVAESIGNDMSATEASERSHGPVWDACKYGEAMPVEAAAVSWMTPTDEDKQAMRALLEI